MEVTDFHLGHFDFLVNIFAVDGDGLKVNEIVI